jgi:large subunit ribosomal protein L1
MAKSGKKHIAQAAKIDREKMYAPFEGITLIKESSFANYDETIEVHFNLGIDPRHADQQLRGTIVLPHGSGKSIKIAVVANDVKAKEALDAGADEAGGDDLIAKIQNGWLDFDLLIATPDMMGKVGRLGRILGAKGLMPNPKSGTVTPDVKKAIGEFKSGKIEYRNDKGGIIHLGIGKKSFSAENLVNNFKLVYDTLQKVKPAKAKGIYIKSISVASSKGNGLFIEPIDVKWEQ